MKQFLLTILFATLIAAPALNAQTYVFDRTISMASTPGRITLDLSGHAYVTLPKLHQVQKIRLNDGVSVSQFGQSGTSGNTTTLLNSPADVTLDGAGNIYIADKGNKRVIKYDQDQNFLWAFDMSPKMPEGVTVGPDGKSYICFSGDGVGLLINNQNTLEQTITTLSTDKFRDPKKVKFDTDGQLYIADRNTGILRISGFSGQQAFVSLLIKKENGNPVIIKNEDLIFTSKGSIIVTSNEDNVSSNLYQGLYRFDKNGAFVDRIGLSGANTTNDGFSAPLGIDIDLNDNIYIADAGNVRIQIWKAIDLQAPVITNLIIQKNTTSSVTLDYALNENGTLFGLFLEEGQTVPQLSDILTPAVGELGFNTLYDTPNEPASYLYEGFAEGKKYYLYYVAVDATGNTTDMAVSELFSTTAQINYLVADQKESTQVSLKMNSTLSGNIFYIIEAYSGQDPGYTTVQQIKDTSQSVSIPYPTAAEEQTLTVDNLTGAGTYRITLFAEDENGVSTPLKHTIFSTLDDIEKIRQRYIEWCIGDGTIDYANPLIDARYQAIIAKARTALPRLASYDYNNPGETYDLVDNRDHINHIRELINTTLFPLTLAYAVPGSDNESNPFYQDNGTRQQILGLFKYLSARGFLSGSKSTFEGGGVYLGLTGYFYASMLLKQELEIEGLLHDVSNNMLWWTRWELINLNDKPWSENQKAALKQADYVRTLYNNRLMALCTLPDDHLDKNIKMAFLADVYNEACEISYGWGGFIKPDYTGYHHHGVWGNAYITEALHVSALMSYVTQQGPYAYSASALHHLSEAMLAYRFYCNKYDNPKSISGRFPSTRGTLLLHSPAMVYLINANSADANQLVPAFKRLWDAPISYLQNTLANDIDASINFRGGLGGLQQLLEVAQLSEPAEADQSGNKVFPYANMQVHRRNGWMVSVKGYGKYVWDYENNGEQNWFGRNQSAGAIEVYANMDPQLDGVSAKASGWQEDGYDWDHVSGTTAFDLPLWSNHDKSYTWAKFSPEYFVGGVALNKQNGVFAMKYVDVRETGWVQRDYKLRANKSVFFFDDQIVCLGSGIKSVHPSYQVHTTLFQNHLSNSSAPSMINGNESANLGLNYSHPDNSAVYMNDALGNSFYLRDASQLKVTRAQQSSRDNRDKRDTQGDFIKAWIDHGSATDAEYEYLLWVQAPEGSIEQLAASPDEYYRVEQKDAIAHVVTHVNKKMTGYAVFQADKIIDKGQVYSTNNDCVLMLADNETGISLSVAHPDLGWLDKDKSLYQVWSVNDANRWLKPVEQPVEVTLNGHWKIDIAHPDVSQVQYDAINDRTTYLFNCYNGESIDISLTRESSVSIGPAQSKAEFTIFPNPSTGVFTVSLERPIDKLEIIGLDGVKVKMLRNLQAGNHTITETMGRGTYIVRISSDGYCCTQKLIIF